VWVKPQLRIPIKSEQTEIVRLPTMEEGGTQSGEVNAGAATVSEQESQECECRDEEGTRIK
jgi:hypothetical protein